MVVGTTAQGLSPGARQARGVWSRPSIRLLWGRRWEYYEGSLIVELYQEATLWALFAPPNEKRVEVSDVLRLLNFTKKMKSKYWR